VAEEHEASEATSGFGEASPTALIPDPIRHGKVTALYTHANPVAVEDQNAQGLRKP
jgi:hypothetical protein